jgi:hypothetical protein
VSRIRIIGEVLEVQVIASGRGVRRAAMLRKRHGGAHWRKLKGVATILDERGETRRAELHCTKRTASGSEA